MSKMAWVLRMFVLLIMRLSSLAIFSVVFGSILLIKSSRLAIEEIT